MKFKALDPMQRDYRGREDECVDDIVGGDYGDIFLSDVLLANCARPSWGTAMEIHEAHGRRIPAFCVVPKPPVSPWLRYHSKAILTSLDSAIDAIIEWAERSGLDSVTVYLCGGINGLTDSECNDWRAHAKQRFAEACK